MALIREAGYEKPIYIHGAVETITEFYQAEGIPLGEIRLVASTDRKTLGGEIVICPPSATQDLWARRFPDPVTAFASGWMRIRARARQKGVELPLVISDHADWDDLLATIREVQAGEIWVTHGEAEALVHWCGTAGLKAKPLHLVTELWRRGRGGVGSGGSRCAGGVKTTAGRVNQRAEATTGRLGAVMPTSAFAMSRARQS